MRAYWLHLLLIVSSSLSADTEWRRLKEDVRTLVSPTYVLWTGGGFATAGIVSIWDDDLSGIIPLGSVEPLADVFDRTADWSIMFGSVLGFKAVSFIYPNKGLETFSSDLLRSLVVANGMVGALKWVVGRPRPRGGDNNSFPSGHAANSAAITTVFWRRYGPVPGVGASAVSALVFASRINGQHHYASDVVAGAFIGSISAWATTRRPRFDSLSFSMLGGTGVWGFSYERCF